MKKSYLLLGSISLFLSLMLVSASLFGQSWTYTNGPYRPHAVKDLAAAVEGSVQTIYAADVETLKVTINGGTSWQNTSGIMLNPLVVAVKPDDADYVHVAKSGLLYRSIDGGTNWGNPKISDANLVPLRLSVSSVSTSVWILGADTVERSGQWTTSLYRTINGGTDWYSVGHFSSIYAHTNVNDICFHPTTSQNAWVGGSKASIGVAPVMNDESTTETKTKGVWYSNDNGASWSFRGGFGSGTDRNVTAMAFSKTTSELLFAVTTKDVSETRKAILYQSGDGGTNWDVTTDLYSAHGVGLVRSLTVNPRDGNDLVAATDKGIIISENRGGSWTLISNTCPDKIGTGYRVMFDRLDLNGDTIYAGTGITVYKSTDQGDTWTDEKGIYSLMDVSGFIIKGSTAHAVSGSFSSVARYSGGSWDRTPQPIGQQKFSGTSATINFTDANYANVCGDSAGASKKIAVIYVRTDGADGWRKVFTTQEHTSDTQFKRIKADSKANSDRVYAVGEFRYNSGFKNLTINNNKGISDWLTYKVDPLNEKCANAIAIDATSGAGYSYSTVLYAGLNDRGAWKSTDGGYSWNLVACNGNSIIDIVLASSTKIYLSSSSNVWRSDNGLTTEPSWISSAGGKRILIHPSYPNSTNHVWIISGDGQKIYKTANDGSYWYEVNTSSLTKPLNDLAREPSDNIYIYVANSSGVYKINPAPEPPASFTLTGSNCTAVQCGSFLGGGTILAPAPCRPILSWSANQEYDIASSGKYQLERKIGSGGSWSTLTVTDNLSYTDGQVELSSSGPYYVYYRAKAKDAVGNYSDYTNERCVMAKSVPSSITMRPSESVDGLLTYEFKVHDNYPNPFNPTTTIRYSLPEQLHVKLTIYDVLGREIAILSNEMQQEGYHEIQFDANNLPSGVYFYYLNAGTYTGLKKMVLVR